MNHANAGQAPSQHARSSRSVKLEAEWTGFGLSAGLSRSVAAGRPGKFARQIDENLEGRRRVSPALVVKARGRQRWRSLVQNPQEQTGLGIRPIVGFHEVANPTNSRTAMRGELALSSVIRPLTSVCKGSPPMRLRR